MEILYALFQTGFFVSGKYSRRNPLRIFAGLCKTCIMITLMVLCGLNDAHASSSDKFALIISADPQWGFLDLVDPADRAEVCQGKDFADVKNLDREIVNLVCKVSCSCNNVLTGTLINSQYKSMNKLKEDEDSKSDGWPIKGIIVNGDLAHPGGGSELKYYREIIPKLKIPYYLGLGNHDNNAETINWVLNTSKKIDKVSIDVKETSWYVLPSFKTEFKGSLSYSFNIGKLHIVQLNNYPSYSTHFKKYDAGIAREIHYAIDPSISTADNTISWLENDLRNAQSKGDTIILNMHNYDGMSGDYLKEFERLVEKYGVTAIFSGHEHKTKKDLSNMISYKKKDGSQIDVYDFYSGSSDCRAYLLVKFDFETDKMTVQKIQNKLNGEYIPDTENPYDMVKNVPDPGFKPITPQTTITFFNDGGFEAKFNLNYDKCNLENKCTKVYEHTGTMRLGNKKVYAIPANSRNFNIEAYTNKGWFIDDHWRLVRKESHEEPPVNNCFKLFGTLYDEKWNNDCH